VVDECFIDFVRESERFTAKKLMKTYQNILVLKAFTKIFSMPGLRLGYVLCSDTSLIDRLRFCGPDWPVSTVAQAAGIAALENGREHIRRTVTYVEKERVRIAEVFADLGFGVFPSFANFILFHSPWQIDLAQELRKNGIIIRDCANMRGLESGYYRTAVLSAEQNSRLIETVRETVRRIV
jgi:threonine-phosphate decarboxylase